MEQIIIIIIMCIYRLPSTVYRLPSTVYRLPSTVYRLPRVKNIRSQLGLGYGLELWTRVRVWVGVMDQG